MKNKFLIIFLIFVVISISFISTVSANFDYTLSNETTVSFLKLPENIKSEVFIFYVKSSSVGNRYYLFTYDSIDGQLACASESTGRFVFLDSNNELSQKLDIYYISSSDVGKDVDFTFHESTSSFNWGSTIVSYYSTQPIYKTTTTSSPFVISDTVLFQQAPPQIQMTQLAQVVEQAETKKTIQEIVGILPLILMIIVGLIGLRKALAFLQKVLRKS